MMEQFQTPNSSPKIYMQVREVALGISELEQGRLENLFGFSTRGPTDDMYLLTGLLSGPSCTKPGPVSKHCSLPSLMRIMKLDLDHH